MPAKNPTVKPPSRQPHLGNPPEYPVGQAHIIEACLHFDFVTGMFGRSYGKSAIFPMLVHKEGAEPRMKDQVYEVAYVAPYYDGARTMYRMLKRVYEAGNLLSDHLGMTGGHNDSELIIHLRPLNGNKGTVIHFWGAENYDALRGHRKHRIVVDECKDVAQEAVFDVLLPMRLGREGRFLFLGTPKRAGQGARWFRMMFRRGQRDEWMDKGYISFTAPSMANPYLTEAEIRSLMDACPDVKTVLEEVYAEILEDDGAVFTRLSEAFSLPFFSPSPRLWMPTERLKLETWDRVYIGLDFGRSVDPSVFSAFSHRTRSQVGLMRHHRVPWPEQMAQVDQFRRLFAPAQVVMVADANGLGNHICEDLGARYGTGFLPVKWNYETKERDITAMRFLFDEARIKMLAVGWQHDEFENYELVSKDSNDRFLAKPKYGAPPKGNDDAVAAGCMVAPFLARSFYGPEAEKPKPAMGSGAWHEARMMGLVTTEPEDPLARFLANRQ